MFTRLVRYVPIKVNILIWHLGMDRLKNQDNLQHKGTNLDFTCSPCCDIVVESINHVFFSCRVASEVWRSISTRRGGNNSNIVYMGDMLQWIDNMSGSLAKRGIMTSIFILLFGGAMELSE